VIRILHLEDDDLDAELIRDALESAGLRCAVQCVGRRDDFERALERGSHDLILSDYTVPGFDGVAALAIANQKRPETPFIFVSGTMGEDAAIESLVSGATDYVLKSKRARLVPAVRRALAESENRRERRRAEDALRSSEARFRGLFEAASDGILILDGSASTVIDANHVAAAMLRRSRQDLVGSRMSDVLLAQAGAGWREAFHELRRRGCVHLEDVRVETACGPVRVELVSRIYQLDGDEVIQVSVRDTTARRAAEEALRQERDLVAAIAETIPVGILRADAEGRIVFANTEVEKILGLPRERLLASRPEDVGCGMTDHSGNHIPEEEQPFVRVMRSGLPASASCAIERPDGRRVLLNVKAAPLRGGSDVVEGVVLALDDVTERKAMESQFLQAQKLEAVGRLAGGVAHDFNNLLTAILSCADMLLDRMPPGDQGREEVAEIETAARRAATLARQLLTFSHRQVVQPRVLDLNEVVTGMDRMLRRLIGEDVALVAVCGPGLGRVKADPGQIEQVIVNLAVNARDAMPDGGRLTIETTNVEVEAGALGLPGLSPGPYVMLTVKDTGHGMDAETQSHLFEPFFTTKEIGKGTGLGLCTVYGIVKQAGGDVRFHSEPERGATFEIYLPRTEQDREWEYTLRAAAYRGTETILLAEDEPQVRTLTARTLRAAGYVVLEASDGEEALRVAAAADRIDVLVTDLVMPRAGGEAVARQLVAERPGVKVLVVSGYPERGMVSPHPGQSWRFLQKPYAPDALAIELRRLIDEPGGDAAALSGGSVETAAPTSPRAALGGESP
jgi:two-component system cell cycle sensor histidine kinase/response regulator CckA